MRFKEVSNIFLSVLIIVFILGSISASEPLYNKLEGAVITQTTAINYSLVNVNNSDYWDGLDNPSDIPGSEFWYNQTGSANCSDCDLDDLADVNTAGAGNGYALIYATGSSTWGAKSLGGLTGWVIDVTAWLFNDSDTLYFNDTKLDDEYVTYVDFDQEIYGSYNITTRGHITSWDGYCDRYNNCYTIGELINVSQKATNGFYLYNDTSIIYFNETQLNATIDARGSGDNASWNETYADTLYANIIWGYNQSDGSYNETYDSLNSTYGKDWYNHTATVYVQWGQWFYNMSDGSYNATYALWSFNQSD